MGRDLVVSWAKQLRQRSLAARLKALMTGFWVHGVAGLGDGAARRLAQAHPEWRFTDGDDPPSDAAYEVLVRGRPSRDLVADQAPPLPLRNCRRSTLRSFELVAVDPRMGGQLQRVPGPPSAPSNLSQVTPVWVVNCNKFRGRRGRGARRRSGRLDRGRRLSRRVFAAGRRCGAARAIVVRSSRSMVSPRSMVCAETKTCCVLLAVV